MAINVTRAKLRTISFDVSEEGEIKVQGCYQLFSDKGDVIAKTSFNGYNEQKINIPSDWAQNTIDSLELDIEKQLHIQ